MIPKPIADELQDELTSFISEGDVMDRFTLKKYLDKAADIPEYDIRHMINGLSYAASGLFDKANESFRVALQSNNSRVQRNYFAYLNTTKQVKKYIEESYKIIGRITAPVIHIVSVNSAIFFGDVDAAKAELDALLKSRPLQNFNYEHIISQYDYFLHNFGDFMSIGKMTKNDFEWMNSQILEVCEKLKAIPLSTQHYIDKECNEIAFITTIATKDPELLANLDFELAMMISENDSFLERGITGWFKPHSGVGVASL